MAGERMLSVLCFDILKGLKHSAKPFPWLAAPCTDAAAVDDNVVLLNRTACVLLHVPQTRRQGIEQGDTQRCW